MVELINPPINTIAKGEIKGLVDHAMGIRPPMAVRVVNTIGKNLISPASRMAASSDFPSARSWLVKSTSKIEFFTSIPAKAIRPMIATKDSELPVIHKAAKAPTIPNGITDNTMIVLLKVLNNNILIEAKSPYTNEPALLLPLSTNIDTLLQFAKFLFTTDLGNIYITTYNLINRGRFTGEYLDSITPVEVQVYLGYCQKQLEQEAGQDTKKEVPTFGSQAPVNPFVKDINNGFI